MDAAVNMQQQAWMQVQALAAVQALQPQIPQSMEPRRSKAEMEALLSKPVEQLVGGEARAVYFRRRREVKKAEMELELAQRAAAEQAAAVEAASAASAAAAAAVSTAPTTAASTVAGTMQPAEDEHMAAVAATKHQGPLAGLLTSLDELKAVMDEHMAETSVPHQPETTGFELTDHDLDAMAEDAGQLAAKQAAEAEARAQREEEEWEAETVELIRRNTKAKNLRQPGKEPKVKRIIVATRMQVAAIRAQGHCTGSELSHTHVSTHCEGNVGCRFTPKMLNIKTFEFAHLEAHPRNGNKNLQILNFVRGGPSAAAMKKFLLTGRFLMPGCHQGTDGQGVM